MCQACHDITTREGLQQEIQGLTQQAQERDVDINFHVADRLFEKLDKYFDDR